LLTQRAHAHKIGGSGESTAKILHSGKHVPVTIRGDHDSDLHAEALRSQYQPTCTQRLVIAVGGQDQETVMTGQRENLQVLGDDRRGYPVTLQ
jgi:uroporphyrinogen-III synthase